MRTTIEIPDEQRARLLQLAAERGEKGFSKLVQEALEKYLDELDGREKRIRDALSVLGKLDDASARQMEETVRKLRKSWR
jgi:metal-responsive CopG/Arc/MetJ family transcriptional regulator